MGSAEEIASIAKTIPAIQTFTAKFLGASADGRAVVLPGSDESPLTIPSIGYYIPLAGDIVRVLRINEQMYVLGPAIPKPTQGQITAVGTADDGATVVDVVTTDNITRNGLRVYDSVIDPTVGDVVSINWPIGGVVDGRFIAASTVALPVPGGGGGAGSGSAEFTADWSGRYYGGAWSSSDDPWISENNTAAWGYGTKISDTIPDGSTIQSIEIFLPLISHQFGLPQVGYHDSPTRPDGNVGSGGLMDLTADSGWVRLDNSVGEYLKVNPGGIVMPADSGGYIRWAGLSADGSSGKLRIVWSG